MAAIAVFMMSGTAVATENVVVVNNNATTVQAGNVIDKLITLINGYTKKVNAVKTLDELEAMAVKFEEEMTAFEEKYADEGMALEGTLTEEQKEKAPKEPKPEAEAEGGEQAKKKPHRRPNHHRRRKPGNKGGNEAE